MLNKILFTLIAMSLASGVVSAQNAGELFSVVGIVIDSASSAPVPDVHVRAGNTGTITDASGVFRITLSPGDKIIFSHVNYRLRVLENPDLTGPRDTLTIGLQEKPNVLTEVTVWSVMEEQELKTKILETNPVLSLYEQYALDNSRRINDLGRIAPPPVPTLSEQFFQSLEGPKEFTLLSTNLNKGILKFIRDRNKSSRPAPRLYGREHYESDPSRITPFTVKPSISSSRDSVVVFQPETAERDSVGGAAEPLVYPGH